MIDAERLSTLFDAHAAPLVLYARQWHDPALSEDIVQEIFVRLMLQRKEPVNVKAWLFKAVRNEASNQARASSRRRRREQAAMQQSWFEPHTVDAMDSVAASEALQSLPPAQREVIVLRIWGQMTLKEAAVVIGSSTSTLYDQYRAGINALRERMGVQCPNAGE